MLKKIPRLGKILAVTGLSVVLLATTLLLQNNTLDSMKGTAKDVAATRSIANPNFTIQHYFYFDEINIYKNSGGNEYVKVLNTDNGGKNENGKIPNNGETEDASYIKLIKNGDRYVPETTQKLTKLFLDEETDFKHNPTITYMDRLWNASGDYNPNYTLKEVWILKPGKEKDSVKKEDFIVYPVPSLENGRHNPDAINFTNNPDNPHITKVEGDKVPEASEYTILIKEDDVIRLVFNTMTTTDYHKTEVDFYDYDLSDGKSNLEVLLLGI